MAVDLGQHTKTKWFDNYRLRVSKCGNIWRNVSSRVSDGGPSSVRNRNIPGNRQKWEIVIREWAVENALTLIFITVMFVFTWLWILIAVAFFGGRLH